MALRRHVFNQQVTTVYFSAENNAFIGSPIWLDCVEVNDVTASEIMELVGQGYSLGADVNGNPVATPPVNPPVVNIADVFAKRLEKLNADYEVAFTLLRDTYPFSETTTWPIQSEEAIAYEVWRVGGRVGPAPSTPLLTGLTAERDVRGVGAGLEDLVNRVLNNTSIYIPAVSTMTAKRHAGEQSLTIAAMQNDLQTLNGITWDFSFTLSSEPTATAPANPEEM